MKFKIRDIDADQQNPNHHLQSSSYSFFTEQAIPAGSRIDNVDGGRLGHDMIPRREMREAIRRELEKERIREEIIAEEMARKRLLEAEVRNELMMERRLAMRRGSSALMPLSLPPSYKFLSEPRFLHRQWVVPEEELVMSVDGKYGRGGQLTEIRDVSGSQIQLLGDSLTPVSEDNEKGKPNGETLSGTKRKSTPPVSEGSNQPGEVRSKKKVKEEWSCVICQISTTSERTLTEHLRGKKHQIKEAALVAQKAGVNVGLGVAPKKLLIKPVQLALTAVDPNTSETNKPSSSSDPTDMKKKNVMNSEKKRHKFKFWCEMCQVGAFFEGVMNSHKEGKKHSTRLIELCQKGKVDSEASATKNTCDPKDKIETKSTMDAGEFKTVKGDMEKVVEENDTTTTGIGAHGCI